MGGGVDPSRQTTPAGDGGDAVPAQYTPGGVDPSRQTTPAGDGRDAVPAQYTPGGVDPSRQPTPAGDGRDAVPQGNVSEPTENCHKHRRRMKTRVEALMDQIKLQN